MLSQKRCCNEPPYYKTRRKKHRLVALGHCVKSSRSKLTIPRIWPDGCIFTKHAVSCALPVRSAVPGSPSSNSAGGCARQRQTRSYAPGVQVAADLIDAVRAAVATHLADRSHPSENGYNPPRAKPPSPVLSSAKSKAAPKNTVHLTPLLRMQTLQMHCKEGPPDVP
jgi:hypothetical protein